MMKHLLLNPLLLGSLASAPASAILTCRPEGPVLPKPRLRDWPPLQAAAANLTRALDAVAVSQTAPAGWPVANVSFSVAIVSRDQGDAGIPLWEYHHLAAANVRGTSTLDRDAQYLIGSVSKVVSDYILLKSPLDLDAPVTRYLPRLGSSSSLVRWEDVSLRMLASQLSGAPTNYGFSEFYYLKDVFRAYGFPHIEDAAYPPCGVIALNGPCSQDDFFKGMAESNPVVAPMERPAYSNIAFTILALAIQEVTGKNYSQLVDELVAKPLRLRNTMPSPGDDARAVIPPGESSWGVDYGNNAPGGGLVSSLADLSRLAHGILARSIDLTPSQTRQWLKPQAYSGGYSAVGMPWEIFRPHNLTPRHPHPVTVLGKGGGAQSYHSQFSIVDEYGIGFIVLSAGSMDAALLLYDALLGTFVPAADGASREQAEEQYARTFKAGVCANSSELEVTFDLDQDSLRVLSMRSNGSDMLEALTKVWSLTMGQFMGNLSPAARLFPTEQDQEATLRGRPVTREVWRLWPELGPAAKSHLPSSGTMADDCLSWTLADWVHYGGEPLDRFLFYKDAQGRVVGFEAPFLRSGILPPAGEKGLC
ncbi:beta-lactamase [Hirsutella rhossiliensis]|uniref:Beta-lactamase domain-containing protein n=1 Tax=Hirsutella rhossiliensis TaxID=111463 RepID=A0A9P8MWE0_9HYPO|nr:beta-lactamase domain-containing protein [Hirsutella rhossiliensis]KAH0961451.1 beta-lactamase domain-containing protein [Hirsutella rhossiliensis]